jgi:hypothetical protein
MNPTIHRPSALDGNTPINLNDWSQALLSEGDSWFDMNQIPASNLLQFQQFGVSTVVINCAVVGDTVTRMVDRLNSVTFRQLLAYRKWDGILFSGGGNDLIDAIWDKSHTPPVSHVLRRAANPASQVETDWINQPALQNLWASLNACFDGLLAMRADALSQNADTPIILHTYDFIVPRPEPARFKPLGLNLRLAGPWLVNALQSVGAPEAVWEAIARNVMAQLGALIAARANPANKVFVARSQGTILPATVNTAGVSGDWANEIHPAKAGYRKLAVPWRVALTEAGLR